jgi:UDPglucose 6-dehydrogenase
LDGVRIAIIGGGYVGLVSAACFAEFGVNVTVAETDERRLTALAAQVLAALDHRVVLVTKSTVPVGTGRRLLRLATERRPDLGIEVASNPEFLREGSAIGDFMRPDRVVVGAESEYAEEVLRRLYRPLNLIETPILMTSLETAELVKYAANSFLAMKVTFINEMADLCEAVGADVHDVARGMGLDKRIGRFFLHPGPGFGGSCFPKDTLALARIAQEARAPSRLTETVASVNEARKAGLGRRIIDAAGGEVRNLRVAVLGLAFKAETDDMRDSPSIPAIEALVDAGASVIAHDPQALTAARPLLPPQIDYAESVAAAIAGADVLVVMTEWNAFRALAPSLLAAEMRGRVIVDLRNVFDPAAMRAAGFRYHSVGRAADAPAPAPAPAPTSAPASATATASI